MYVAVAGYSFGGNRPLPRLPCTMLVLNIPQILLIETLEIQMGKCLPKEIA